MLLFSFIGLIFFTSVLAAISHIVGITNFGKAFVRVILFFIGLIVLGSITSPLRTKMIVDKDDYYGEYVINRKLFPGEQADWQYNSFRFEIKKNDSIYFYKTAGQKILQTYRGTIRVTDNYDSKRLIINMEQPTHHILNSNPTTYRKTWSFYLVLESPEFYNVFFKKGKWKPIKK